MKVLKICLIVLSSGIFITSCHSGTDCPTSTVNASQNTSINPADGTGTAANGADTAGTASLNGGKSTPDNESMSAKPGIHSRRSNHKGSKHDTLAAANGPDLKASQKREGNFTNGIGPDFQGK